MRFFVHTNGTLYKVKAESGESIVRFWQRGRVWAYSRHSESELQTLSSFREITAEQAAEILKGRKG